MKRRELIMLFEAMAWVGIPTLLGLIVNRTTDIPVPIAVFVVVGVALGLGTIIEIWVPGPLTGKRHPKDPEERRPR